MAELPQKVAFRAEPGTPAENRAQRLAQQLALALEATKTIVAMLANKAYANLALDTTIAATGSYVDLVSTTIRTKAPRTALVTTFTASGLKTTALGSGFFRVLVNGVVVRAFCVTSPAAYAWSASALVKTPVNAGTHTVTMQWATDSNSLRVFPVTATEHAAMLVQEVTE